VVYDQSKPNDKAKTAQKDALEHLIIRLSLIDNNLHQPVGVTVADLNKFKG
jgi:hypothetical protein